RPRAPRPGRLRALDGPAGPAGDEVRLRLVAGVGARVPPAPPDRPQLTRPRQGLRGPGRRGGRPVPPHRRPRHPGALVVPRPRPRHRLPHRPRHRPRHALTGRRPPAPDPSDPAPPPIAPPGPASGRPARTTSDQPARPPLPTEGRS